MPQAVQNPDGTWTYHDKKPKKQPSSQEKAQLIDMINQNKRAHTGQDLTPTETKHYYDQWNDYDAFQKDFDTTKKITSGKTGGGGGDIDPKDEQIANLQNENSQLKTAANDIKDAAFQGFQRFHDLQEKQYADLDNRLGGLSASIRDIIGNVEETTGNPVVIDDEFIGEIEELRDQFGGNEEQFARFVTDKARNNAQNAGQQFRQQHGAAIQEGGAMVAGTEQGGKAMELEIPAYTMDDFASISPAKATGRLLELLNNPDSTSEEILLGVMMMEMSGADQAAERTQKYLEKSAERTKTYLAEYQNMLAAQKQDLLAIQKQETALITEQHSAAEQEIMDRKASTMEDLSDKRSRLEGYMKAKLKAEGVLDSTFGLNQFVTSVTKFDALMVSTERGFAQELRQLDNDRTAAILTLTKELISISHSYDQKLLEVEEAANSRLDEIGLASLRSADEQDSKKMGSFAQFSKDFMANRAEREKAIREALEKAQEQMLEQARQYTEDIGIVHDVYNGEIVMMFNEDGTPMKTWDRVKEENKDQWEREKFGANYNLQLEKEEYDQWESTAKLNLDRQYKSGQLSIAQYKAELAGLKEVREQEEYTWEVSDKYTKEGVPRWEQSDLFSRTDRHNNPTATAYPSQKSSFAPLAALGLEEGVDYWQGAKFGGGVTMAFKDIETGIMATTALLDNHQIASHYGKDGYVGKRAIVDTMSQIFIEEGKTKKRIPYDISADKLQELFRILPDWRKSEVTMAIYGVENNGGISQGAFKSMTPNGNIEPELPVWETLNLNRFGQKYNATKEDMIDMKTLWAQQKQQGMSLAQFQDWIKGMLANGRGGQSAGATPTPANALTAGPKTGQSNDAASFLGF